MVFHIMIWAVASEPINFDFKYPYMYTKKYMNIYTFSKVISITGISIMPHPLPSVYRILSSTLRKVIELFMQLVSSAINHPDHLLPF